MSWITFGGEKPPLIIMQTPFRPVWTEEVDEISVPGKARRLRKSTGVHTDQPLTVYAAAESADLREIYRVLSGEGQLVLSTAPDELLHARVDSITPEGTALDMAELRINFTCSPFAYAAAPTTVPMKRDYTEVGNAGTVYSEPVITFRVKKDSAPLLMGDVNFDGKVNAVDASMVITEYANIQTGGEPTFTDLQREAADMNSDGAVNSIDAALILDAYAKQQTGGASDPGAEKLAEITVNGATLVVGLPAAAVRNGFEVTVDSEHGLLYYTNADGARVNIMYLSSGDLPLLHTGMNYARYSGDIEDVVITVNERYY